MNKERRTIVGVIASITKAYTGERTMPNKVLMVLRDSVKALAETEQRSVAKMESFKDNDSTAQNYRVAVACREDLLGAQEALEEGELEEALVFLERVANPERDAPVVSKKGRRK